MWWLLGVGALTLLFLIEPILDLRTEARIRDTGVPVEGTVLGSWDGGRRVPVSFTPPGGGDQVTATAWGPIDSSAAIGPVDLQVDPRDLQQVRVAGPLETIDVLEGAALFGTVIVALLLWLLARHRCQRRSERLAAAEQPAYRMVGVPVPGRVARSRWRLHLYPLDVGSGAVPVCTIPIIGEAGSTHRRLVDVKGEPRPGGAAVVLEPEADRIWWPAGRALVTGRTPLPEPGRAAADIHRGGNRWWILALGIVFVVYAMVGGEDPISMEERGQTVEAKVVDGHGRGVQPTPVRYHVEGRTYRSEPPLAGPQRTGDRVVLAYDPDSPGRTWQPGTDEELPGTAPPADDLALFAGLVLIACGVVVARPATGAAWRRDRWAAWPGLRFDGRGGGPQPLR